jgi:hypothetical protein
MVHSDNASSAGSVRICSRLTDTGYIANVEGSGVLDRAQRARSVVAGRAEFGQCRDDRVAHRRRGGQDHWHDEDHEYHRDGTPDAA